MKDNHTHKERSELASDLREILRTTPDRDYARAFCRCVLGNFRTGLIGTPKRDADGRWRPRKRGFRHAS